MKDNKIDVQTFCAIIEGKGVTKKRWRYKVVLKYGHIKSVVSNGCKIIRLWIDFCFKYFSIVILQNNNKNHKKICKFMLIEYDV